MSRLSRSVAFVLGIFRPVVIMFLIGMVFYLGIQSERTGFVREVLDPGLKRITLPVLNALRGTPPASAALALFIEPGPMDSIRAIRARALNAGVLNEGKDDWFPAVVLWSGDSLPIRLRLKGGLTDHLRTRKWSYRVQLPPGDTLLGMQTFSLQHPNTRNFTYEWIFHQALQDQGLPFLLYELIDVHLNGQNLGLHAIEQHFDSTLLVRLGLGNGPVMKFDDEVRIATLERMNERSFPSVPPMEGDWLSAPIEAFHLKDVLARPGPKTAFQKAVSKLDAFRQGILPAHEVFDVDAMARLFALGDLLGGQHCTDWRNLRFAPDTSTGYLLPIGFDANAGEPITAIRALREQGPLRFDGKATGFYDRLFSDTLFYTRYIHWLDVYSTDGWLEGLLERVGPGLDLRLRRVQSEFPNFRHDPSIFMHDRTVIRQTVRPSTPALAYLQDRHGIRAVLALSSTQGLPVEALGVIADTDTLLFQSPVLLPPRAPEEPMELRMVDVSIPRTGGKMKLLVRMFGLTDLHTVPLHPWAVSSGNDREQ